MTQHSLTVHAHFRRGLAKTIHSRVSRTTSAAQRVPEHNACRLPYERAVEAACFTSVELFIMPSIQFPRCSSLTGPHFCACR